MDDLLACGESDRCNHTSGEGEVGLKDSFDTAFKMLCNFEGYKSEVKADRGGMTIWGISERWFPEDVKKMKNMTVEDAKEYAKEFYRVNFWMKLDCDTLPYPLDIIVFDTAVNCGLNVAKKILSQVGGNWRDYIFRRMFYYLLVTKTRENQNTFLKGWLNRCLSLWVSFHREV